MLETLCRSCLLVPQCKEKKTDCTEYKPADNGGSLFKYHTVPYEHQKKCLYFMCANKQAALFLDMGTGKTKIVLDYIVNNDLRPVLILCPKSVLSVWKNEIFKHTPELINDAGYIETKEEIGKYQISITNYEKVRLWIRDFIKIKYQLMICDESTKIKNFRATVTKRVIYLGSKIPNRYIMSGTPIVNDEIDIWSQFLFMDQGKTFGSNLYEFRQKYYTPDLYTPAWVIRPGAHNEITKKMRPLSYIISKKDCLDLPDKVYETRDIPMTSEQDRVYGEMYRTFEARINSESNLSTQWILAQLIFLQEIASGYIHNPETNETHAIPHNKITYLNEILEEIPDKKVILWVRFTYNLIEIEENLKKTRRPYLILKSSMSTRQRSDILNMFTTGEAPYVLITNPALSGYGLNLTCAHYAIYYSNSFNYSDRIQSEDRLHRIGQKNKVTYIDLITKNTIETRITNVLQKKQNLLESILEGIKKTG